MAGSPADVVHYSLETDVTRLVKEGLVAEDWKDNATKGIATSSVVVFVVRAFRQEGKPRHPAEIVDYGFFARDALPPDTTRGTRARLAELFDAAAISPRW